MNLSPHEISCVGECQVIAKRSTRCWLGHTRRSSMARCQAVGEHSDGPYVDGMNHELHSGNYCLKAHLYSRELASNAGGMYGKSIAERSLAPSSLYGDKKLARTLGFIVSFCLISACCPGVGFASGEGIFSSSCIACHKGGGNIVQPGATLSLRDMEKNGILDVNAVYRVVYSGKGKMYGFGEQCTPRGKCTFGARLSDAEVQEVADFVWEKASRGWQ